jgi:hypothetical protein
MTARYWVGLLIWASLGTMALLVSAVGAQESRSGSDAFSVPESPSPAPVDEALLAAVVKDLGLSLSQSSETNLRVPLMPREWSFNGLRPYAALSPRVLKPVTEGLTGLAIPSRESREDLSHGFGLGAGLQWQLSERFGLFGEYLFQPTPGAGAPSSTPGLRPNAEGPAGLKGGFSFHF